MSDKIRCAVIGLGRLGFIHAEHLATKIPGARLLTVVDAILERAEQVATAIGDCRWTNDPREVFDDDAIDAVVIATPTHTHAELVTLAAQSGKHIFVEKPLTETLAEADKVIRAIADHNVFCQVGFMRRFDPAYAEARRRVAAGDIGKPIYFNGMTRDNPPGKFPMSAPIQFLKQSGGIFLDLAIHDYDSARFLIGSEVTSVTAVGDILVHDFMYEYGDADQAITYLRFASGACGVVESSRNSPYGFELRCEIIGTEGAIQIGSPTDRKITLLNGQGKHYPLSVFPSAVKETYLLEMIHFIESVQTGTKPSCSESDGKAALQIALAATQSFRTGISVSTKDVSDKA